MIEILFKKKNTSSVSIRKKRVRTEERTEGIPLYTTVAWRSLTLAIEYCLGKGKDTLQMLVTRSWLRAWAWCFLFTEFVVILIACYHGEQTLQHLPPCKVLDTAAGALRTCMLTSADL